MKDPKDLKLAKVGSSFAIICMDKAINNLLVFTPMFEFAFQNLNMTVY